MSTKEYTMEFEHLMMICDIAESEEQTIADYLSELRVKIDNVV